MEEVNVEARYFLESCWVGEGHVTGITGRKLRAFTVDYITKWSEAHEAFYVDERVRYADGRSFERNWAITLDQDFNWSGTDDAAGRMRLRTRRGALIIDFDRANVGKAIAVRSLRLKLRQVSANKVIGVGTSRLAFLPVARTIVSFSRIGASDRA